MGCACRSLERVDALSEVRTMAHQHLDAWLDQLAPLFEQPRAPTLQELSGLFTRTRSQLLGGCLQALTEALYGELREQRQIDCPGCAKRLSRKRLDPKQLNTLQGTFTLERPYFYCQDCNRGYHPLDQALELTRAFHQYDVQEKVLKLATEMPYERAAELVSELTGVAVSNHHGHATLSRVAESADLDTVIPDESEIRRRIEQAKASAQDKPVLVAALDGAHAPTRSRARRNQKRGTGQWREVKGIRLYLAPAEGRIIQLASWHQIQDAEATRRDLHQIAARIPQQAVRIALLGDGAAWVWSTLGECAFPTGSAGARLLPLQRTPAQTGRVAIRRACPSGAMGRSHLGAAVTRSRLARHRRNPPDATPQRRGLGRARPTDYLPAEPARAPGLRRLPQPRHTHRQRRHRIGQQVYQPCAAETLRRLVGGGKRQCDAATTLRHV